jgi:hypothetical protein
VNGERRVNIRRMAMIRQPAAQVFAALRDDLSSVARGVHGIDEIRLIEREVGSGGTVRTVHEWRAAAALSPAFRAQIDGGVLTWIERAVWEEDRLESNWSVESRILGGGLTGTGSTRVERAMGGRGSRLHLEVSASVAPGALGPLGAGRWKTGLEDAAAKLLARTLQDLGAAVEVYLSGGPDRARHPQ